MSWIEKVFSDSSEASFGRTAAGLWLLACIAWNTYRLVAIQFHPLPLESELIGQAIVGVALYGPTKAGDILAKFWK
jgi:hypothetical protein